ncbi:hypothetical protein BKG83_20855 [Mycobacteroides chelonae]|jgi:hypothetical protein|uniref:Uncharacterized protein n=1 Tax=Mycobacteroides chelonae TaxID=1774 RepID=A0A1S1LZ28_MYCCH|nr:hypothetical protein [Mycobacteroides chelonae]PKQ58756.1 hypothetical protein B5566_08115 [Mycobacterium sp. MHSD3]SKO33449.1 Uncharacterised protein [Mycobacteroides abscessus subsp. bolletii]MBF9521962.1 hypothetical protein [Mycobacteroides chelonae]OHU49788.1 hypothetical protein BKG83_20855 [Mycobacteroides chelonae]OHU75908.1 hypothetical protein BKG84_25790 [Mycobacteroides chelonae]
MNRYLTIAGLLAGSAVFSLAVYLYVLTPLLLVLIGIGTYIPQKSRPFSIGILAAAAGSVVFIIVLAAGQSMVPPGVETYGPGYVK